MRYLPIILIFCFSCNPDVSKNNSRLNEMVVALDALPRPTGVTFLSEKNKIGVCGNGNHCDFFAGRLFSFKNDFKAIEKFYADLPDDTSLGKPEARLVVNKKELPCCFFETLKDWNVDSTISDSLYVLLFFKNDEANSDIRCH